MNTLESDPLRTVNACVRELCTRANALGVFDANEYGELGQILMNSKHALEDATIWLRKHRPASWKQKLNEMVDAWWRAQKTASDIVLGFDEPEQSYAAIMCFGRMKLNCLMVTRECIADIIEAHALKIENENVDAHPET